MMLAILLTSLLIPAVQQNGEDQIVRLRDGRLLVGAIVEHDLDGLVLTTALDGGRYQLSWRDLFPGEAERLRDNFGYRNQTQVPMTTAHRVLLQNGREIIGRLLREDNRNLEIRVRDTTSLVPKSRLAAPPEEVVVEASTILTPEQYYAERVPKIDSTSRFAHFDFAQELEVMFALDEAKAHYLLSQEIASAEGDTALLNRIEGALAKLEDTIANRVEAQKLDMVRQMMHRDRYTVAEGLLAEFDQEHSDSPLRGEYLQLADRFEERRDAAVTRYLERHWFSRVVKVLKRKSLEKGVAMDQLSSWLETEVPLLVRQQLLIELKDMDSHLDLGSIDARWLARLETAPTAHTAGFNDGTWILGAERATVGLKDEEEKKDDGKSDQQREMEDRMKRYLDNIQATRRSASGGAGDVSPEDWWRRASVTSRFQWMLAYYSEFSGDYNVIAVKFTFCQTCAGSGYIEIMDVSQNGARQRKKKCPTCHGIQVRRSVSFK
ncbi:MAG: hypothetical protein QM477_00835 [Planctomycetota bacterium]